MTGRVGEQAQPFEGIGPRAALRIDEAEAGVDVQVVDAQVGQPLAVAQRGGQRVAAEVVARRPHRRPAQVGERQPVEVLGREAHAEQKVVADRGTHRGNHLLQQAEALLDRAAIGIAPAIGGRVEELVKDVAL
jgi:hypothetical protein